MKDKWRASTGSTIRRRKFLGSALLSLAGSVIQASWNILDQQWRGMKEWRVVLLVITCSHTENFKWCKWWLCLRQALLNVRLQMLGIRKVRKLRTTAHTGKRFGWQTSSWKGRRKLRNWTVIKVSTNSGRGCWNGQFGDVFSYALRIRKQGF